MTPWSFEHSVPSPDVDEPINRHLHRRAAFALLSTVRPLAHKISPNLITVIAALLGLAAGCAVAYAGHALEGSARVNVTLLAAGLLFASVVFDCSDGMLARLTGQTSEFGAVLDGAADTVVVTSAWVGLALHLHWVTDAAVWVWPGAVATALFALLQIAAYDQLKQRYRAAMEGRTATQTTLPPPRLAVVRPFWAMYAAVYPVAVAVCIGPDLPRPPTRDEDRRHVQRAMAHGRWLGLGLRLGFMYTTLVVLAFWPVAALPAMTLGLVITLLPQIQTRRHWRAAAANIDRDDRAPSGADWR